MLRHGLPPSDLWGQPLQQVLPYLGSLLHFPADSALRMLSELEPSLSLSYQIELVATAGESLHFPWKQRFQQRSSRSEHLQSSHGRLSSLLDWWPNSHPRFESGYFYKL